MRINWVNMCKALKHYEEHSKTQRELNGSSRGGGVIVVVVIAKILLPED